MLEAVLTLIVFLPVLYGLMSNLVDRRRFALGGFVVTAFVGQRLVGLEVQNQVVEAAVRKHLVVLEVDPSSITSESCVLSAFRPNLRDLRKNYRRLYANFALLATWLALYEQAAVVVPYLIAGPLLFADHPSDRITLGVLVQLSNAFGKVFDAFNTVADNWLAVNEWRSVLVRLREFEQMHYHAQAQARLAQHPVVPARTTTPVVELVGSAASLPPSPSRERV